jgi:signal transduction histidine kinase
VLLGSFLVALGALGAAGIAGVALRAGGASRAAGIAVGTMVLAACGLGWLSGRYAQRAAVLAEAAARVRAQLSRRRTDRLVTVSQLADGIAHELGTPLAVISERSRLISAHAGADPALVAHSGSIERQARRMSELIRQLIDFARTQRPSLSTLDLRTVVRQTIELHRAAAATVGVELVAELPRSRVPVEANAPRLHRALGNLITNAIQAQPQGGRVIIGLRFETVAPPDRSRPARPHACCWVEDRGVGISDDVISRVFEPFFTTRTVGEGSGLGLAVSHGIVQEHGGWIAVHSQAGQGSRFSVYLPRSGNVCPEAS